MTPGAGQAPAAIATKPGTAADIDLLWPMVEELHRHERLPKAGPPVRTALEHLLASPDWGRALLVRFDGRLAGYMVLTFGFSLEFHGRFGLVDELYVAPDYRSRGLGAALLAEAEEVCKREGMAAVRVEVEHTNFDAERLYSRCGFGRHERRLMTKWLA